MSALFVVMRAINRLNDWVGRLVSLAILPIFALLILEIVVRLVAGSPLVWTGELTQLLFGVYAVLSGGYILAHREHVNVDLLFSRFSRRGQATIDIFTAALMFLFLGALVYFGSSLAYESISFFERSQSAWNPPIWPAKLAIPVGAVLLLLQGLVKFVQDIMTALDLPLPADLVPPGQGAVAP
jgi:TRAP-type mannitol/chloroaromatic compound transport system permease small subunit